ncbi:UBP-type zinc finger domain-containing protein [Brachybacterium muris]|uniref:UBP-type zinc finger domain-containing protein n=1 Tax=Brachybacterium muris TaxID=219301 RepID=UPI000A05FD72
MRYVDPHVALIRPVRPRTPGECEDCVAAGARWLHLRMCRTCGKVGCCDSSPMRHARTHELTAGRNLSRWMRPLGVRRRAGRSAGRLGWRDC